MQTCSYVSDKVHSFVVAQDMLSQANVIYTPLFLFLVMYIVLGELPLQVLQLSSGRGLIRMDRQHAKVHVLACTPDVSVYTTYR